MSWVRRASFVKPPKLTVCAWFDGQSDMRPRPGSAVESSRAQRAVPDQRVVVVVEPRPVVCDAQHVTLVGPFGADVEIVGARVVRQRAPRRRC